MSKLTITVDCSDDSDLDWLKHRCIGSVEDAVETAKEEGRIDGTVEVEWDIDLD